MPPVKTIPPRGRSWHAGSHVLREDKLTVFGTLRAEAIRRFDRNGDGWLSNAERSQARLTLAETPGAAWALSRCGEDGMAVPAGGAEAALADLPVAALRLGPAAVAELRGSA